MLRRTNSAERLTNGKNYEELQQLLDELHTNVKQAKDIQAKLKNSIVPEEGGAGQFPPPPQSETPPPPPLRTSSRLSMDEESLPPPPPELQSVHMPVTTTAAQPLQHHHHHTSTLPRKNLPPIAPKPNLTRVPGSPKFKHSYGTLPNPAKKSPSSLSSNGEQKYKSGRRISFDDNIQLIDETSGSGGKLTSDNRGHQLNPVFIQGLEKVVSQQHRLPPQHPAEPLYTAVVKPGSCRPRHYPAPNVRPHHNGNAVSAVHGSPSAVSKVCCVGPLRCHNSSGDSSPEQLRQYGYGGQHGGHSQGDTYRSYGDYWSHDTPGQHRSCSEEKARPCDDIRTHQGLHGPRHSSVPSSPVQTPTSRLWGSFRGGVKKPPTIDKKVLVNPYHKTAS